MKIRVMVMFGVVALAIAAALYWGRPPVMAQSNENFGLEGGLVHHSDPSAVTARPGVGKRSKEEEERILKADYAGAGSTYAERRVWEKHAMAYVDAIPEMLRRESLTMEEWLAIPVKKRYEILDRYTK